MSGGLFSLWGCGRGPLRLLAPHVRISSGVMVGVACLVVPLRDIPGVVFICATTVCWCALSGMPAKMLLRCALASVILFFPFLLLTPWMNVDASSPVFNRLANAGAIALRSTGCLFISFSIIAACEIGEVHRGLSALPLPRPVVALIVQLINQTMLLTEETVRIIQVLRLRGAPGVQGGRMIFSFPVVWMVRLVFKAERTAAAMTVRGYGIETATARDKIDMTVPDVLTVATSFVLIVVSVLMRLGISI